MLILTRRIGETLMIGDEVSVTVLGVKGNQVRLGVNAPKDIAVHREEIYQRILHEKTGEEPSAYPADASHSEFGYDNSRGFQSKPFQERGERLGLNSERRYPRASHHASQPQSPLGQAGLATYSGFGTKERNPSHDMNHLENRSFGSNANFNQSFDPFDEDYYNR